jgi:NADH-quinone oxidoreductase subunit H
MFTSVEIVILLLPILLVVASSTLLERKVLASIQRRRGPNIVGWNGLLQAIADAVKLMFKEGIIPTSVNTTLFLAAPVIFLSLSLINWTVMYVNTVSISIENNIFLILLCSSLSVYGILLAGWASNSAYAFIGAIRSIAQLISYEISFALIIMSVIVTSSF